MKKTILCLCLCVSACAANVSGPPKPDKSALIEMTAFLKEATAACGRTPYMFLYKEKPGELLITNGVIQFLNRQFGFYAKCEPDTGVAKEIDPKTSAGL